MTTDGTKIAISARGKNSLKIPVYFPGTSLAGCVASFQIRNVANGKPSTKALEKTSGTDSELTITSTSTAITARGVLVPIGSGCVTLDLFPDTIQGIPDGEYLCELKLIWPAIAPNPPFKQPLFWGPFVRESTINDA